MKRTALIILLLLLGCAAQKPTAKKLIVYYNGRQSIQFFDYDSIKINQKTFVVIIDSSARVINTTFKEE